MGAPLKRAAAHMRSIPSRGVMASQGIANPSYLLGSASSILVDSASYVDVVQLVERRLAKAKVMGSNPIIHSNR